jgi:serine/threonine protein kinase
MGACAGKTAEKAPPKPAETKPPENPKPPTPEADKPQEQPKAVEAAPAPQAEEANAEEKTDEDAISISTGLEEFYELGEEIGRGGFSVVFEAKHKENGMKVAVKCVQLACQADDEAMTALKREIRIMKKVNHPNILKLYEVFVEEESFYLVMELVPGKELFERIIDRGQYSERHASNIIRQIVSAVDYLHSNGIAHRDLKPENLLSSGDDENEVIKIIDFGLSKKFGDEQLVTSVGSPGYVAPEVLTAESYDKSVDMWSVGVILYILLCGFPPFFADTSTELFKKIIEVKYDFDDPAWDDVSEAPKEIIRKLLVKDPKERITAHDLAEHPWVKGIGVAEKQLGAGTKMKTSNLK